MAVELLEEYRSIVEPVIPMNALLDAFVPDYYGLGLSYQQYLAEYHEHVGRVSDAQFYLLRVKRKLLRIYWNKLAKISKAVLPAPNKKQRSMPSISAS